MKNALSMLTGLALLGVTTGANAAVISVVDALPTENVIASQSSFNNQRSVRNNSGGLRDGGQSFAVTSDTLLDAVYIRIHTGDTAVGADAPGATMEIRIHVMGSAGDDSPNSLVGSESGLLPATIVPGDYLRFDLATNLALTGGTVYAYELHFPDQATDRRINLAIQTGDSYAGGQVLEKDGTANYDGDGNEWDYLFAAQAVPEPASLALLGLGGAMMFGRRRS